MEAGRSNQLIKVIKRKTGKKKVVKKEGKKEMNRKERIATHS
jgi:hypothetical protein